MSVRPYTVTFKELQGNNMNTATNARSERQQPANSSVTSSQHDAEDLTELVAEISTAVERYCRNRPRGVAGVLFAFGFVVGWKAKPW
jgi:hypothetical protein